MSEILDNSGPSTSPNRAYLASCLRHFAQIPLQEISDTLRTLAEMLLKVTEDERSEEAL